MADDSTQDKWAYPDGCTESDWITLVFDPRVSSLLHHVPLHPLDSLVAMLDVAKTAALSKSYNLLPDTTTQSPLLTQSEIFRCMRTYEQLAALAEQHPKGYIAKFAGTHLPALEWYVSSLVDVLVPEEVPDGVTPAAYQEYRKFAKQIGNLSDYWDHGVAFTSGGMISFEDLTDSTKAAFAQRISDEYPGVPHQPYIQTIPPTPYVEISTVFEVEGPAKKQ